MWGNLVDPVDCEDESDLSDAIGIATQRLAPLLVDDLSIAAARLEGAVRLYRAAQGPVVDAANMSSKVTGLDVSM